MVAYRLSPLSYAVVKSMISLDYISMVNIAANDDLMPEFIQGEVRGEALSQALLPYLTDIKKRAMTSDALIDQTNKMRGPKNVTASAQAAQAILRILA